MPNDEPMEDLDDDQYVPEGGITIGDIYIPPPPAPACTFDATGPRYTYYLVTQKLPQIYTANHATFQIQIRKITVHIGGNFWVTQNIITA